jgi:pimeloyl-ACP methyl ester carboxylesterase
LTALAVAPRSAIRLVTQTEKRTFMSSNGTLACCSFLQEQPDFLKEAVTGGLVLQEEMILSWHLEYDWESPVWRHLWRGLARENTLIRYDARGNGLSDWGVHDISLDAWVSDVETVVDAIGLERFPLLGISQGSAISIAYAVRHPERVSHLILYGGFALGANKCSGADKAQRQAMVTLMRLGWGLDNSAFRQMFASMFIPEGTKEQSDWFNELHRKTTSPDWLAILTGRPISTFEIYCHESPHPLL